MNKTLSLLLLVLGILASQLSFSQNTYLIPYGLGIDTLHVKAGEKITSPLVFYEEGDKFTRGESLNGIVPISSHGYSFFVDHPRFMEDTINGTISLIAGTFSNDPNTLLAMKDDRTGGDMKEPITVHSTAKDNNFFSGITYLAGGFSLLILICFLWLFRRRLF